MNLPNNGRVSEEGAGSAGDDHRPGVARSGFASPGFLATTATFGTRFPSVRASTRASRFFLGLICRAYAVAIPLSVWFARPSIETVDFIFIMLFSSLQETLMLKNWSVAREVVFFACAIPTNISRHFRPWLGVEREEKGGFANRQDTSDRGLQVSTFKQLHSATGSLSEPNVVGHSGFGPGYRGVPSDGLKVCC